MSLPEGVCAREMMLVHPDVNHLGLPITFPTLPLANIKYLLYFILVKDEVGKIAGDQSRALIEDLKWRDEMR